MGFQRTLKTTTECILKKVFFDLENFCKLNKKGGVKIYLK